MLARWIFNVDHSRQVRHAAPFLALSHITAARCTTKLSSRDSRQVRHAAADSAFIHSVAAPFNTHFRVAASWRSSHQLRHAAAVSALTHRAVAPRSTRRSSRNPCHVRNAAAVSALTHRIAARLANQSRAIASWRQSRQIRHAAAVSAFIHRIAARCSTRLNSRQLCKALSAAAATHRRIATESTCSAAILRAKKSTHDAMPRASNWQHHTERTRRSCTRARSSPAATMCQWAIAQPSSLAHHHCSARLKKWRLGVENHVLHVENARACDGIVSRLAPYSTSRSRSVRKS